MSRQLWGFIICFTMTIITHSQGLHFFMDTTPDNVFCGRLQCSFDKNNSDNNMFSILGLVVYDMTQPNNSIKLASLSVFGPDICLRENEINGVYATGNISLSHAELSLGLRNKSHCLTGSFLCELEVVNASSQPDVIRRSISPWNSGNCHITEKENIEKQVVEFGKENAHLQNTVVNLQIQIIELEKDNVKLQKQVLDHEKENVRLKNTIAELVKHILEFQNENTKGEKQVVEFDNDTVKLEKQVVKFGSAIVNLENQVLNLSSAIVNFEKQVVELKNATVELENHVAAVENENVKFRKQVVQLQKENATFENQAVAETVNENVIFEKKVAQFDKENVKFEKQATELEKTTNTLEKEVHEMSKEKGNSTLEKEVYEMSTEKGNTTLVKEVHEMSQEKRNNSLEKEAHEMPKKKVALKSEASELNEKVNVTKDSTQDVCIKGTKHRNSREKFLLWGKVPALCDTETDGGGWIVIQRRTKGDVDFYRDWNDYKNGFGTPDTDFWIGNDVIYNFVSQGQTELRFDLKFNERQYYTHYSDFKIANESSNYRLSVRWRDGTSNDNSFRYNNGSDFLTYDRDNIRYCATHHGGGWWYSHSPKHDFNICTLININGVWGAEDLTSLFFYGFAYTVSVHVSEMKIRYVDRPRA